MKPAKGLEEILQPLAQSIVHESDDDDHNEQRTIPTTQPKQITKKNFDGNPTENKEHTDSSQTDSEQDKNETRHEDINETTTTQNEDVTITKNTIKTNIKDTPHGKTKGKKANNIEGRNTQPIRTSERIRTKNTNN